MANIDISHKFIAANDISNDEIFSYIKDRIQNTCKVSNMYQSKDVLLVEGCVREGVFTRVTKFKISISVKVSGRDVRLGADGKSTCNWVFIVFFIIGLFTGVMLLVALVLYLMQRGKPSEAIAAIFKSADSQYGVI